MQSILKPHVYIYWVRSITFIRSTFPTYFPCINVWFRKTFFFFFGLYWGSNFGTRGNVTKGVKPLFSHRNFVQVLLPIRKKSI